MFRLHGVLELCLKLIVLTYYIEALYADWTLVSILIFLLRLLMHLLFYLFGAQSSFSSFTLLVHEGYDLFQTDLFHLVHTLQVLLELLLEGQLLLVLLIFQLLLCLFNLLEEKTFVAS